MSRISLPRNPNPWSGVAVPLKRATNPVVRHVARDMRGRTEAAGVRASHRLPSTSRSSSIVAQAREVIDCILDDPDPRLAANRQRLRTRVAACPGFPDRALLEHLIETCSQANTERQPDKPAAPVVVRRVAPRRERDSSAASATPYARVSAGTGPGWGAVLPGLQQVLRAGHDGRYS